MKEPSHRADELAHAVIGAAIEVHRSLGPGYLEAVYEEALAVEFAMRGIPHDRQRVISVFYKKRQVGEGRLDFLVESCLPVELKAVEKFAPVHKAQMISYLKASGCHLGLLINFQVPVLKQGIQRVVYSIE